VWSIRLLGRLVDAAQGHAALNVNFRHAADFANMRG
jgi:hypothetical protein